MDREIDLLQRRSADDARVIVLGGGLPSVETFPKDALARAFARLVSREDAGMQYGWPEGQERLRAVIASRSDFGLEIDEPEQHHDRLGPDDYAELLEDDDHCGRLHASPSTRIVVIPLRPHMRPESFRCGSNLRRPPGAFRYSNPHRRRRGFFLARDAASAELRSGKCLRSFAQIDLCGAQIRAG